MGKLKTKLVGQCALCKKHSHNFPDDSWHEVKHAAGWHSCKVYGGFRFNMPKCEKWELDNETVFFGAA